MSESCAREKRERLRWENSFLTRFWKRSCLLASKKRKKKEEERIVEEGGRGKRKSIGTSYVTTEELNTGQHFTCREKRNINS